MIFTVELDGYYAELMQRFVEDCGAPSAEVLTRSILTDILDDEYREPINGEAA
jgi:hypothetical protein